MHIVVTGSIGVGKSTVCRKVIYICRGKGYVCGGVLTFKDTTGDIILEDVSSGTKIIFASCQPEFTGLQVGKYYFNPDSVALGNNILEKQSGSPIFIIDEIGPLELESKGFTGAVNLINKKKTGCCITVIRKSLLSSFLPMFEEAPVVFEITLENRDVMPVQVYEQLSESMKPT